MRSLAFLCFIAFSAFLEAQSPSQKLPVKYEELAAPDFSAAVNKSGGVVIIPLGILEKHGPHMPLGTDLITVRHIAVAAAELEYAVVFPPYFFGQINEARHQPGTIAYSPQLIWNILQETCNELSRNGFRKIVLVNGHGGNNDFLKYFVFCQNAEMHPYGLYLYQPETNAALESEVSKMIRSTVPENHAGEREASELMYIRPDLVKPEKANTQNGKDMERMTGIPDFYTALWWYASFPEHYSGDASQANTDLGKKLIEAQVKKLAASLMQVKNDTVLHQLQQQFQNESKHPLNTKQ